MQALKQAIASTPDELLEQFRSEEKRRRELEFKALNNTPASQKLSKGEKKRAKRARRIGYGNPCTLR